MEKAFFEQMGGTYHQDGDYFLPDLLPPENISVGIWGQRRKHYLKTHREPIYTALLLHIPGREPHVHGELAPLRRR